MELPSNTVTTVDHIVYARYILPVVPRHKLYENCALLIKDEHIVDIVTSDTAAQSFLSEKPENTHRLDHHCVMPGLINMHGHAAMSLLRGYADDMPLQDWLNKAIWPAEAQHVSADFVKAGTELAMAEMLLSGTTCFSDMYFYPDSCAAAASRAGMRANVYFPVLDFPSVWARDADEYLSKGLDIADEYRSSELITVGFGPHAPYTVSDAALARITTLASEMDAVVHIHLHETQQEVEDSLTQSGKRPVERLAELGMLSPRLHAVHMTAASTEDIELLTQHNAHIIHCPASNMKLASGFTPVDQMQQAGLNLALGTDGAASNNQLDLFCEMRLASLLAKGYSKNASAFDATASIESVTINAARALGREDDLGSLGAGKLADLIAIDLRSMAQEPLMSVSVAPKASDAGSSILAQTKSPVHRLLSQLVYTSVGNQVSHVWVAGRLLVQEKRLQNGIYERAKQGLSYAVC